MHILFIFKVVINRKISFDFVSGTLFSTGSYCRVQTVRNNASYRHIDFVGSLSSFRQLINIITVDD